MKKILLFGLTFFVLVSFLLVSAYADDSKVYTIESARFDVVLNEDGSADISEIWDVNYVSGEFSHFRKEIMLKVSPLEYFSNLSNIAVYIDGEKLPSSHTDGYSITRETDRLIIYANKKSENVRHVYTFSYKLTGVVKRLDEGTSCFSYRFVGANHPSNIKDIYVNISAPAPATFQTDALSCGEEVIQGRTISYHAENSRGLYSVTLKIYSDKAFGTEYTPKDRNVYLNEAEVICAFLLFLVVGAIFCINVRKKEAMLEKDLNNPTLIGELIQQLEWELSPCQIVSLSLVKGGSCKIITVALAELVSSGHIILSEDGERMIVNHSMPEPELMYQRELISLIKEIYEACHGSRSAISDSGAELSLAEFTDCIISQPRNYSLRGILRSGVEFVNDWDESKDARQLRRMIRKRLKAIHYFLSGRRLFIHPREKAICNTLNRLLPLLQKQDFAQTPFSALLNEAQKGKLETMTVIAYMCSVFSSELAEPLDLVFAPLANSNLWPGETQAFISDHVVTDGYGGGYGGGSGGGGGGGCGGCGAG